MKALITGVTSGMGYDMARILNNMGYEIIGVARDKEKLNELHKTFGYEVHNVDLADRPQVLKFCDVIESLDIDVFINNAGFGDVGFFNETSLDTDLKMIEVNLVTYHILTKTILNMMLEKNSGYILNVSSSASFMPGPYMCTYYSTKAYVTRMSEAIYEEIRRQGKNVHISVLCPGPVDTNFNNVAGVSFAAKSVSSSYVASYAIKQMFKNKLIIVPSFSIKAVYYLCRFVPKKTLLKMTFNIQKKKKM